MHGDLFWFGHLHIIPNSFDLGTVLTTQERTYEVFNAFRDQGHVLTDILQTAVEGFTIVGEPDNSPNILPALNGFVVTVTVSPTGPVTIAAQIDYGFGGIGAVKTINFTGARVIIMATPPDARVSERWSWKTDIIQAASGDEQRISVRDAPRESWQYKFTRTDTELAPLINQLWGWHANVWPLPIWTDYTFLSADVAMGALNIPVVSTDERDFRDGELALIWDSEFNFEAVEIVSRTSTNIVIQLPTLQAWSEDTFVMPLQLAKLPKGWQATNWNVNARELNVLWQTVDNKSFEDTVSPQPLFDGGTYRSLPVWDIESDYLITSGKYGENENNDVQVFGDELGKFVTMTPRDFPKNTLTGLRGEAFGRTEFWRLRNFMHSFRGRQKSIWVPSGRDDFTVESTKTPPSTELNVNIVNYTTLIADAPDGARTRRNIMIKYIDGTRDFRRVLSSQITPGVREVLTLDSTISQDASIANVEKISFLVKRRLSTDDIAFEHDFYEGEVATSTFGLVDIYDGE
jgi:hypothetical protein